MGNEIQSLSFPYFIRNVSSKSSIVVYIIKQ